MNDQGKRAMKPLIKSKREKMKENQNKIYHGGPLILKNERGVVGVPTNGDMLGEPVISVYLPED